MRVFPAIRVDGLGIHVALAARWHDAVARFRPRQRHLARLRSDWGRPGAKAGEYARRYFDWTRDRSTETGIDDQTWDDLEFPEIFRRMDATLTPLGSQVLYAELHRGDIDPALLASRYRTCGEFADDRVLREAVQLRLLPLAGDEHGVIADALFGAHEQRPTHRLRIWAWSLLSLAVLIAVPFSAVALGLWFALLATNLAILVRTSWRRGREAHALQCCAALLDAADRLAALHPQYPGQPQLATLAQEAPRRARMRKGIRLSVAYAYLRQALPPPFSGIFPILDVAFLATLAIHAGAARRFAATRPLLHASFIAVGEIDALIAVAGYLQRFPRHCAPQFVAARPFAIGAGLHPLLRDGVANSITIGERSILVTGSNMAGKTTFIKMLACNAILGQTLGFCVAASATLPRARVLASIHGVQSVASGKSHYFAEIEAVDRFIRAAAQGGACIIALDEPFSGTNTIERIAIARAVLAALARHAIVLVTTHDVELQGYLADRFDLYHFQENPDVAGYFDHALKRGAATRRNAIRLLQRLGFPEDITAAALEYAKDAARPGEPPSAADGAGPECRP